MRRRIPQRSPIRPKGVDNALTIERARAGIVVPDGIADRDRFLAERLTKNESRNLNELSLLLVIPAKAGIQGGQGRSGCPWTPAFAGVTITCYKAGIHFGSGSQGGEEGGDAGQRPAR